MKIYTDTPEGSTVVRNSFIDQYMPHASGEFVKVYLYLLRCANSGRELSLSSIADVFEHTEKDVRRALTYWEKQGLVRTSLARDGSLEALTFVESLPGSFAPGHTGTGDGLYGDGMSAEAGGGRTDADEKGGYGTGTQKAVKQPEAGSSGQQAAGAAIQHVNKGEQEENMPIGKLPARAQQELRQLFLIAEQYLQRPLSSSEQSDYVYYYHALHFSADLIEYLLEYCISKGSASRHYMRKVALSWAEAGITTVAQAKRETTLHNKNYYAIMNAFGIKGRSPAPPEQELMTRWLKEYGFPLEIVLEACRRTISQTHQPSFAYADKILSQWHEAQVRSMQDIEALDQKRQQEQAGQKKAGRQAQSRQQRSSGNRFNNFSQREYDYGELEKKLLGQQ